MRDFTGESVVRYVVIEKLGSGNQGGVYRVLDPILKRAVGIKFLDPEGMEGAYSGNGFSDFAREAQLIVNLAHPNIVSVYDYGVFDGFPYLVMQYISSGSLRKILQLAIPMEYRRAVRLACGAARALEYAHHQNILHRSLHPENILIDHDDEPLLCDFAIAKMRLLSDKTTNPYLPAGCTTAKFLPQDDQYSLAAILFEMVTGKIPVCGPTKMEWVSARRILPALPEELDAVLARALAVDPAERYANMGDMAQDLDRVYLGKPVMTPPVLVRDSIAPPDTATSPAAAEENSDALPEVAPLEYFTVQPASLRRKRSKIWRWLVIGLILLTALAAVLYVVQRY